MEYCEDKDNIDSSKLANGKPQQVDALQTWERTLIDNLLNFAGTPKVYTLNLLWAYVTSSLWLIVLCHNYNHPAHQEFCTYGHTFCA